jgi:hypothetical protein
VGLNSGGKKKTRKEKKTSWAEQSHTRDFLDDLVPEIFHF